MSPEQAAGRLDLLAPTSDVYSLGATLYCVLTGKPPVEGELGLMLQKVQRGEFSRPRQLRRDIPAGLEAICLRAMALEPNDRYRSAQALADDLEHWLGDEPIQAMPESLSRRVARWGRHHRTSVQVGAAALVMLTIVSICAAVLIRGASEREAAANNERLAAAGREVQAKAMAAMTRSFEIGLSAPRWDLTDYTSLESLVNDIHSYDAGAGAEASTRLETRFAAVVEAAIRQPRLTEAEMDVIQSQIDVLGKKRGADARNLSELLAQRRVQWRQTALLEEPFSTQSELFGSQPLEVDAGKLALMHHIRDNDLGPPAILTATTGAGAVRLEAEFEAAWQNVRHLGVTLQIQPNRGYDFLLRVTNPRLDDRPQSAMLPVSFAEGSRATKR